LIYYLYYAAVYVRARHWQALYEHPVTESPCPKEVCVGEEVRQEENGRSQR